MKTYSKIIMALALLLLATPAFAQVQKGYVRTVGRPNNPKGTRITGVTIRVAGLHSPVVSQSNGYFEFDLGGGKTSYSVTSVRDNSYQYELQEKELLNRKEPVSSSVPKEIVMVSLAEKRAIEAKKRQQIENQYQNDIARLEEQKANAQITIEQYRQQLQQLQEAFDKRDMLISQLSEHFASIDYAQLSEEQARISALLEEGDLLTADSIINAKGNFEDRLEQYLNFSNENDKMAAALKQRREDQLSNKKDLMRDCESKYLIYKQQYKNDSAEMFLDILVRLDTMSVGNLNLAGDFSDDLAHYDKAMDFYQRALRIAQNQQGENTRNVVTCYNKIGFLYKELGDYDKSLESYSKALELCKSQFGENHPDVADCYSGIGLVYEDQNRYVEALEYFEKALVMREAEFGESHPSVALSYNSIGVIHHRQGNYDKAMEYFEKSLEISKASFGEISMPVSRGYNNIGNVCYEQGNLDKALEYFEKSLEIRKTIFKENHLSVATGYTNIGSVYYSKDDYPHAMEYFAKSLEITKRVLGDNHPELAVDYNNLGSLQTMFGNYAEALANYEKSLAIRLNVFGEMHSDVAVSYANFGYLYYRQDSLTKALHYFEKAAEIQKAVLGENHPELAKTYYKIASVQLELDDYVQAMENYIKSYDLFLVTLGKEYADEVSADMEVVYEKAKGKRDKEAKRAAQSYEKWKKQNQKN